MQTIMSPTSSAAESEGVLGRGSVEAGTTPAGDRKRLAAPPLVRRSLIAIAVAGAVGSAAFASPATAESGTVKVKGTLANQTITGPDCASPVDLCFKGEIRGSLKGRDEGIVQTLMPTSDPDVVFGEADLKIQDKQGDLNCRELFVLNISPTDDGHFSWNCEITGGTGRYAGASGYLHGIGNASPTTGATTATYRGVITLT
jgi:hypothetical protein